MIDSNTEKMAPVVLSVLACVLIYAADLALTQTSQTSKPPVVVCLHVHVAVINKVGRGNSGHGIIRGNSGHFNVATGKKHPFILASSEL